MLYVQVDPSKLDHAGYQCLRNFFETINLAERKLRKVSSTYHNIVSSYIQSSQHINTVLSSHCVCVCVCVFVCVCLDC